jgi:hypothetical protein
MLRSAAEQDGFRVGLDFVSARLRLETHGPLVSAPPGARPRPAKDGAKERPLAWFVEHACANDETVWGPTPVPWLLWRGLGRVRSPAGAVATCWAPAGSHVQLFIARSVA